MLNGLVSAGVEFVVVGGVAGALHGAERVTNDLDIVYDAEDDAQVWDREPEVLKEEFRRYARQAIALLEQEYANRPQEKEFQISYAA